MMSLRIDHGDPVSLVIAVHVVVVLFLYNEFYPRILSFLFLNLNSVLNLFLHRLSLFETKVLLYIFILFVINPLSLLFYSQEIHSFFLSISK